MSAPSPHTPPRPGQKFRFKPGAVIEFSKVLATEWLFINMGSPAEWFFINMGSHLLFEPKKILQYLKNKHIRPI